jgi:hypothetical protein
MDALSPGGSSRSPKCHGQTKKAWRRRRLHLQPVHERLVLLYILRVLAGEHNSSRRGTRSSIVVNACVCAARVAMDQSQEAHKTLSTGRSLATRRSPYLRDVTFSKVTAQARSCLIKQAADTELPIRMLEQPTQIDG